MGRWPQGYDFAVGGPETRQIEFDYACADARRLGNTLVVEFQIEGAVTPLSLGLGQDNRLLGLGMEWIELQRWPAGAH